MDQKLKTSEQWQQENMDVIVMDPDGWNRSNYQYSWFEEKITKEEYTKRILHSTCMINKKVLKD